MACRDCNKCQKSMTCLACICRAVNAISRPYAVSRPKVHCLQSMSLLFPTSEKLVQCMWLDVSLDMSSVYTTYTVYNQLYQYAEIWRAPFRSNANPSKCCELVKVVPSAEAKHLYTREMPKAADSICCNLYCLH